MTTPLSIVVAVSENGVIGRDGGMPWHLPDELRHFRRLTMGHIVLMGRRTFESLPAALDGRRMWVLSRDPAFRAAQVRRFGALEDALAAAGDEELMVIGGASVYAQALPLARRIVLTRVHAVVDGDAHFPDPDPAAWDSRVLASHPADQRNRYPFTVIEYLRR